jgi:hypothetical protein
LDARPDLRRRAAAEAIGVFALVFAGCGAIVAEAENPGALGHSASPSPSAWW